MWNDPAERWIQKTASPEQMLTYWEGLRAAARHPHPSSGSPATEQVRQTYINQMLDVGTESVQGCKTQLPLTLVGLNSIYHARYRGITEREKY